MCVGVHVREAGGRRESTLSTCAALHLLLSELSFIHMHAVAKYLIKGGAIILVSLVFNGHTLKQRAHKLKV